MEPRDFWRTSWSERRAAARSDLFDVAAIRDDVRVVLQQLMSRTIDGPRPPGLSLELIATRRQSACLLDRSDEAALLFDVSQSMVLKQLLGLIEADRPYDEFARLTAACAGLSVAHESPALCEALMSICVPAEAQYVHSLEDVFAHYQGFRQILPSLLLQHRSSLVDGYLLAHEVSHFLLKHPSKLMLRLRSGAGAAFDFALEQVCYERRPDFAELAQYGGAVPLEAAALERIRNDLTSRRRSYEANREHLIEEIACDSYALLMTAVIHIETWRRETDDVDEALEGYFGFARTFFILVALSDLHQAMIGRAKLSVVSGVASEKPGAIADMHFRKMALTYAIAEQAMPSLPAHLRVPASFPALLGRTTEVIGNLKHALDALIVMPVTNVVTARIHEFEESHSGSRKVEGEPWRRKLASVFGAEWLRATFEDSAVQELVGPEPGGTRA